MRVLPNAGQYFGGSLALVPMEGFGTDCYVTLNVSNERLIFCSDSALLLPLLLRRPFRGSEHDERLPFAHDRTLFSTR